MSKKTLITIIVALLFLVAINFYTNGQDDKQYKELEIENLKQENAKLQQNIDNLIADLQKLETTRAVDVAKEFKKKQLTVNYDENYGSRRFSALEEIKKVQENFGDYTTKEEMEYLRLYRILSYINRLSQETKSNLSVKNISVDVTGVETEKITLDYDIEIEFDPLEQKGEKKSISNFGQMRLIKTEGSWKVDADLQRMKSINEVKGLLNKQGS
ncbi:hypothetical protein LG329_15880 [Virgibacillus necropolis]|uniref:hypothetical protein n=1 Tax=Virgibacillus necropolis TaxID=163877 RepID=UPI00384EED16